MHDTSETVCDPLHIDRSMSVSKGESSVYIIITFKLKPNFIYIPGDELKVAKSLCRPILYIRQSPLRYVITISDVVNCWKIQFE